MKPLLGTGLATAEETCTWISGRVVEIEQFTGTLPSIAVLVCKEEYVQPITNGLNTFLEKHNIRAEACPEGKVVGRENDVRVFDVRHIKGLEFEAVFFVGIDELAAQEPDLFEKYLYVGATRAAVYLGVTVQTDELPEKIKTLRMEFGADWNGK